MSYARRSFHTTVLTLAAAIVLAFGLALATAAPAQAADDYGLIVAGTEVTSDNADDVLGDGTVSYDSATQTLTLTEARFTLAPMQNASGAAIRPSYAGIACDHDLTIVLNGMCDIYANGVIEANVAAAIAVAGDLSIVGDGSLDIPCEAQLQHPDPSSSFPTTSLFGIAGYPVQTDTAPGGGMLNYGDVYIGKNVTIGMNLATTCEMGTSSIAGIVGGKVTVDGAFIVLTTGPVSLVGAGIMAYEGVEIVEDSYVNVSASKLHIDESLPVGNNTRAFLAGIIAANAPVHIGGLAKVEARGTDSEMFAFGIVGLTVTIDGEADVIATASADKVAAGIAGGEDAMRAIIGAQPPESPENPIVISDRAIVAAMGSSTAFDKEPDISGHKVGGAWVNTECDLDRANATKWTGDLALGGEISPFKYVRIPEKAAITRIAGDEANQTAAAIAALECDTCDVVVLAREDDYADALGATGLAGTLKCPILLTDRETLSPAAAEQIKAMGATKVYIIGGEGAMKVQLETDLEEQCGVTDIKRLWGEASYDTSLACAKEIVALGGNRHDAIIAMSMNFQDALSISPIAYQRRSPVILQTWGETSADRGFTDEAKEFLADDKLLYVVGGTGAISEESLEGLKVAERLWGETGYDTSNKIAEWYIDFYWTEPTNVVIACGAQDPKGVDALAGAVLAGKLGVGVPILLVNGNEAMEPVDTTTIDGFLTDNASKVNRCYVLGGAYVMPEALYETIAEVIGAASTEA